jgi:hypothetical protein
MPCPRHHRAIGRFPVSLPLVNMHPHLATSLTVCCSASTYL